MTLDLRLPSRPVWLTDLRQNQNVVIPMTGNQPTRRPVTARRSVTWRAVRRTARALKHIQDDQVLMWEGFWRASRFPED